jgi:hypothetical protein
MERTVFGIPVKVSSVTSRLNILVIGLLCLFTNITVIGCSLDSDDAVNPFLGKWKATAGDN